MKKISFEMDDEDFDTLVTILHDYVVKHNYDIATNDSYSEEQVRWHKKHAYYVQNDILDKIILGIQK